jgi:hypothetical protein
MKHMTRILIRYTPLVTRTAGRIAFREHRQRQSLACTSSYSRKRRKRDAALNRRSEAIGPVSNAPNSSRFIGQPKCRNKISAVRLLDCSNNRTARADARGSFPAVYSPDEPKCWQWTRTQRIGTQQDLVCSHLVRCSPHPAFRARIVGKYFGCRNALSLPLNRQN